MIRLCGNRLGADSRGWRPRVVSQAAPIFREMGGVENERLKRLASDESLKFNVQRKGAQGTESELTQLPDTVPVPVTCTTLA